MPRKFLTLLAAIGALAGLYAPSVSSQQERDVMEVMRSQIATQRQALVAENLQLTESESDKFWPVYRDFQYDRNPLIDQRLDNIKNFRDNYETMTDEQAKAIIDSVVKYEEDMLKLQKKYIKEFRKVLPEKKVMRYMQIERKLDAVIDYDIARVIPLQESS
jgi:gas vesicle protein